ncbi:GtrA family protein [Pseudomonas mendocina]|nr:GtrA family protein [Pseudomonas mendocina]MBH3341405.1 GtrA family protein [Pseudomonas mendocina]
MPARLLREMIIASRFTLVGITATGVHILVLWLLISHAGLSTLLANLFAFMTAFGISFAGNYIWTFSAPGQPYKAVRRFLLISGTAFVTNSLLLAWLLSTKWLAPIHAALFCAAAIPAITFVASRLWGFNYSRRAPEK